VAHEDGQVIVTTPHDRFAFDFVILSTGLVSDPRLRPELAALARISPCGAIAWPCPKQNATP
jgi:hypothetical protein